LEWILSLCAGVRFHVSADNLIDPTPAAPFRWAIAEHARAQLEAGLHERARRFAEALVDASGRAWPRGEALSELAPL